MLFGLQAGKAVQRVLHRQAQQKRILVTLQSLRAQGHRSMSSQES
jgi:hypothetical protein